MQSDEQRVVIVTGAARGIGRGHALEFARQGYAVVVNDLGAEVDGSGGSTGPAGEVVDGDGAQGLLREQALGSRQDRQLAVVTRGARDTASPGGGIGRRQGHRPRIPAGRG